MAREFKRDAAGKFTTGGGVSSSPPATPAEAKPASTVRAVAKTAAIATGVVGVGAAAAILGDRKLTHDSLARREAFHAAAVLRNSNATANW